MLSENKIKNLVKDNEPYLTLLEELDRTGKLRKANYKGRYNFTIDENLMIRFRKYCEKSNRSMSGIVESLIKDFIKRR